MNHFRYDVKQKRIINYSELKPTDLANGTTNALWAENNKYRKKIIKSNKIGTWTLFFEASTINDIWEKVKLAIQNNQLWKAEVKRTSHHIIRNSNQPFLADFVLIIYTRNNRYLRDAIAVLSYLEKHQIKVPHEIIYFQQQNLTQHHKKHKVKKQVKFASNQIRQQQKFRYPELLLTFSFIALPILIINETYKWLKQRHLTKRQKAKAKNQK